MKHRGIILAGGTGSRLYPATLTISKHLLPIYDKPMIYYPLSILMLADIRDILIISTPEDLPRYEKLFGTGEQWGLNFQYAVQPYPGGLPQAFLLGRSFIGNDHTALILGDNIFYGHNLQARLQNARQRDVGATVFAYHVHDPERYGVVEFDVTGKVLSIEEKPLHPKSAYAITGLYFYDQQAISIAQDLKPSARNELEITDLNRIYFEQNQLHVELMGRGFAWFDMGTHESFLSASQFVHTLEIRQRYKIACPEEIAFRKKWINETQLEKLIDPLKKNDYGRYLQNILHEEKYSYTHDDKYPLLASII